MTNFNTATTETAIDSSDYNDNFTEIEARVTKGAGSPEGVKTSGIGSFYGDTTGGDAYIKESGTSNTGWKELAKATDLASYLPLAGGTMTGDIAMGSNSITGLAAPSSDNDAARKKYVDDLTDALSYFKEYGLTLTNGTDTDHDIDIAAGSRWDSTYASEINLSAGITIAIDASGALGLDTGSVDNTGTPTQYYIWLCSGSSGTTGIFSLSASSPTLPSGYDSYKVCIGRIITNTDTPGNIDNTQLWTKHPDGTESYVYTQASGNFPNANTTVTHNFNTSNSDVFVYAKHNTNLTLHHLTSYEDTTANKYYAAYYIGATNTITVFKGTGFYIPPETAAISNSASYRLVVKIRTRLS